MSTTRSITAVTLLSLFALASCGSVQVPYEACEDRNEPMALPLTDVATQSAVTFEETSIRHILETASFAAPGGDLPQMGGTGIDNESGAEIDWDAEPMSLRRRQTGGSSTRLGILIGARTRSSTDWQQVDDQINLGVEFSFKPKYFPIGVEVGILYAFTDEDVGSGVSIESTTAELYFGPRYEWSIPEGTLKFIIGGGASLIRNDVEQIVGSAKQDFDDSTFGGYLHGGLELMVSKGFGIGFDLRGVWSGDATFNGVKADPSYYQGAVTFGLHF